MSEHDGEDCCDNCNELNDDFVGKSMFGSHDAVKIVDVDLKTFSPNLDIIKKNVTKKTRAIMLINVLGNCSEIDKIKQFAKKKKFT